MNKHPVVYFYNDEPLNVLGITAFGVSAKEDGSIGYFGTGLKYAIAICVRHGLSIRITVGDEIYDFGKVVEKFRGKEFEFITMNGEKLSFTTELGKNWELWQAFRELACNALDEGGGITDDNSQVRGTETVIEVRGEEMHQVYEARDTILLPETKPIARMETIDIHPGKSRYMFYRGVRVYELPRPSMYTYNLQGHVSLTEDRTIESPFLVGYRIVRQMARDAPAEIVYDVSRADDGFYEARLDWSDIEGIEPSKEFMSAVRDLSTRRENVNSQILQVFHNQERKQMRAADSVELNLVEQDMLNKALGYVRLIDRRADYSQVEIVIVEHLGSGVLAQVSNRKVFLSRMLFTQGIKKLVHALYEEWVHIDTGYGDCSRALQTYLFEKLVDTAELQYGKAF